MLKAGRAENLSGLNGTVADHRAKAHGMRVKKKRAPKANSSRVASRDFIPKSFEWHGYSFQWVRHKRAFRIVHRSNGFVGYVKGTANQVKSAAVVFQLRQLVDTAARAVDSLDKMQECLSAHRRDFEIEIADARRVLEDTGSDLEWAPDDVEPDE